VGVDALQVGQVELGQVDGAVVADGDTGHELEGGVGGAHAVSGGTDERATAGHERCRPVGLALAHPVAVPEIDVAGVVDGHAAGREVHEGSAGRATGLVPQLGHRGDGAVGRDLPEQVPAPVHDEQVAGGVEGDGAGDHVAPGPVAGDDGGHAGGEVEAPHARDCRGREVQGAVVEGHRVGDDADVEGAAGDRPARRGHDRADR
jgi:hypothetical protein